MFERSQIGRWALVNYFRSLFAVYEPRVYYDVRSMCYRLGYTDILIVSSEDLDMWNEIYPNDNGHLFMDMINSVEEI